MLRGRALDAISRTARKETEPWCSSSPYLKETASQTAGPYVHIGLIPHMAGFDIFEKNFGNVLAGPNTKGERITLEGRVLDGTGTPLRDVLLEIWQADADGRYNHPADRAPGALDEISAAGAAPAPISTPGSITLRDHQAGRRRRQDGDAKCAPHVNVWIVARGINIGLNTRIYFSDEEAGQRRGPGAESDRAAGAANDPDRQAQRARRQGRSTTFTIHLQGPDETVFFDV